MYPHHSLHTTAQPLAGQSVAQPTDEPITAWQFLKGYTLKLIPEVESWGSLMQMASSPGPIPQSVLQISFQYWTKVNMSIGASEMDLGTIDKSELIPSPTFSFTSCG